MADDGVPYWAIALWGVLVLVGLAFWSFIGYLAYLLVEWATHK